MTQNIFDQLSKQYLEEFLTPLGVVQRQYEIPGEAKYVDVWFVPNPDFVPPHDLGLLGRMAQQSCLFEPYSSVPSRTEVRVSLMKLVWIQEDERRKAQRDELSEDELSRLWILAASTSKPLLIEAKAEMQSDWPVGVYFMAGILKTAIVAIDQLPETEETLWLRVLGRGKTQERAIREVLALPVDHARRDEILRLLVSWKVRIDLSELEDFIKAEETLMAFSEAFLEWEQQTIERLRQRVVQEVRQEVRQEVKQEVRQEVKQEVRQEVKQEVRQEVKQEVRQEVKQEVRQEVKQEVSQEERQAIALNMLNDGLAITQIARLTGLAPDQIEELQGQRPQN